MRRTAGEELDGVLRQPGIEAGGRDLEPGNSLTFAERIDLERAAAWNGAGADQQHIEEELHPVLSQQFARQIPGQGRLAVLQQSARGLFRIAEVDLRTGRSGRAEGKPAELQLG